MWDCVWFLSDAFPDASDKNQTQSHCYNVNDCQKTNFVSKRRYAFYVLKMNAYLLLLTNHDLLVKGHLRIQKYVLTSFY